jgi:glutaredoxin 2
VEVHLHIPIFEMISFIFALLMLQRLSSGFVITSRSFGGSRSSLRMAHDFVKPNRVISKPLPRLYVYDHCPFCVRVRLAFGLKNIKHELYFLGNDDVDTPTALIGKKIAPIFEYNPKSIVMPESLDIIAKIDGDSDFGPTNLFKPMSGRKDIAEWQAKHADLGRIFQRPRYMMTVLPEFASIDGKRAYIRNHALPNYAKEVWLALSGDQRQKLYEEMYQHSLTRMDELNAALKELDDLIHCPKCVTEGGLSLDDIDLWARLRSMTLIKGAVFPEKLRSYLDYFEKEGDLPLYFALAC